MESYDVVILGGGNAGFGVIGPTRDSGLDVLMVEPGDLGGTCPNRGCVPKKVLVAAAHVLDEIARAHVHSIELGSARLDWAGLIDREKRLIAGIPDRLAATLEGRGVALIRAEGRFVSPNEIEADGQRIEARHVVIATGSKPRPLPFPGAELMITSDEILGERGQPGSVVFVGGGVVALEFSHVYARAGTAVTILEVAAQLLPAFDEDAVALLRAESERAGISIHTEVEAKRVERANGRFRTMFEAGGREHGIESDRVVNGTGRIANVGELGLDAGNVAHDGVKVLVDEFLRSVSNPAVYACGDLTASPQLSPIATYEGALVGRNIVEGPKLRPDYASIPSCVFTIPALASVGLTEAKAGQKGLAVEVHVNDMADWISAKTFAEITAWSKIIVDKNTGRIAGAHFVGHGGEELINIFGLAMKHGIAASDLREFVFAYPTFSADIKSML